MISADLGKSLEQFVSQLAESGRYGSKSEVLREGVRLIQEREAKLAALNAAIARRLSEEEAKYTIAANETFNRLEAKQAALAWNNFNEQYGSFADEFSTL